MKKKSEEDKTEEVVTTEEFNREKAVAQMKKVWVSQGWQNPEERLVVAEFGEFLWVIPIYPSEQLQSDKQRIIHNSLTFETEFLATLNQVKTLRRMKDMEWGATERLYQLAPKNEQL